MKIMYDRKTTNYLYEKIKVFLLTEKEGKISNKSESYRNLEPNSFFNNSESPVSQKIKYHSVKMKKILLIPKQDVKNKN